MIKNFSIYAKLILIQIKTQTEYRKAFIILFISKLFGLAAGFLMILVLLHKFRNIMGWNKYELFFLYSLDAFSYAFAGQFFMRSSSRLSKYIQTGEFDIILTKPMPNFGYYIFREFSTGYFSNLILCAVMIIVSLTKLEIPFSPGNVLFLILTLAGAFLIQASTFLFSTVPSFWTVKNSALQGFLLGDMKRIIQYPVSLYNKAIQIIVTFVLPYAFINFIPAQYFLKKHDALLDSPVLPFLTPAVGILLFGASYIFWRFGVNHYESTGS